MLPRVPEIGAAQSVLGELRHQLRLALADPPSPERCRELLVSLDEIGEIGIWCREAGLALARRAQPQITFAEMQRLTGVSDATLPDRYRRWTQEES